ncbi:carbon monoxide dehydrogenase subunit G [Paraburkholderia sp. BL23I1N1]|uniref:SRPBCC family protein n=1 Tax=Paraburkholderia sp. BL23I1N1 TaxID=1938802 RepID=UPI000E73D8E1|nr:SRPBCC family protein [Paraburkholderia sp. BL23I1N1]RKE39010.1 carbon monoxide dehydrogenase subunit G [Paraburkholderia sp. BL23I1N1]
MEIVNRFSVDSTIANTWKALLDVPLVASCFPGATLTDTLGKDSYKGMIRVRLGPIAMEFAGTVTLNAPLGDGYAATVEATWQETKNRGSATTVSTFSLSRLSDAAGTQIDVRTTVQMAGQVAQYGRGVGIINAVSEQMVRQFTANLLKKLADRPAATEASLVDAEAFASTSTGEREPVAATRSDNTADSTNEISVLGLLWATVVAKCRQWLARPHSS